MQLRVVHRIPRFRGLIADQMGNVWGMRGPWLVSFSPPYDACRKIALLPPGWRRLAARSWLLARLLRLDVFRMVRTSNGDFFATSAQGLMRCKSGEQSFQVVFRDFQGPRPLSLCLDDEERLYFGEYFNNAERRAVRIFVSRDGGDHWTPCYEFAPGTIRHVHNLIFDPHRRAIWVLTGDYGDEAQIGLATTDFSEYRIVAAGSQQTRALAAVPTAEGLIYATDTPLEQNYVYALAEKTGALRPLAKVQQSVFFMATACAGAWLSTVVEPSEALPTKSVHVWYSPDDLNWTEVFSAPRGRLSLRYFQYPAVFFADSPRSCPVAFLSLRGAKGFDGDCLVVDVTP